MVAIDKLYRKIGFNKPGHFMSPPAINAGTFFFPLVSEYYNFKVTDVADSVSKATPLLRKADKVMVITKLNYSSKVEGRFRILPFNINKFILELGTKEKNMIFLRPTEAKRTITKQTLMVYNYGCINYNVRYQETAFTKLWKYKNTFYTVIEDLNKPNGKNKFLLFELPSYLPSREKLDLFAKDLNLPRLKSLPNYKYLNLLEVWKFLTPELKENSILYSIKPDIKNTINIIFQVDNSVVLFNLGILERLVKEYVENKKESDIIVSTEDYLSNYDMILPIEGINYSFEALEMITKTVYPSKILKRLFYVMINKMASKKNPDDAPTEESILKGFSSDVKVEETKIKKDTEIEKQDKEGDLVLNGGSLEKALDEIIVKETPIYNSKDEDDNDVFGERKVIEDEEDEEKLEESSDVNIVLEKTDEFVHYNSLSEVMTETTPVIPNSITKSISALKDNGLISKSQEVNIKNHLNNQKVDKCSYPGLHEFTIEEILDDSKDAESDVINKETIRDTDVVFDKTFNLNTVNQLDKHYINKNMKKDTVRTIYSLQNANMVVEDHMVYIKENILGATEYHEVRVKPLNAPAVNLKFSIPVVKEDGTFKMSGNTYRMRKQRTEIPIRKISSTQVVLNSYYSKLFVSKAIGKNSDFGYWFQREIMKREDQFGGVVLDTLDPVDLDLPLIYAQIARYVKSFYYGPSYLKFSYYDRIPTNELKKEVVESIKIREKNLSCVFIGLNPTNGEYYFIGKDNNIHIFNSDLNPVRQENFLTFLGMKKDDGPIEFASLKVVKAQIPLGIILSYYFGIENLLRILKVKHVLLSEEDSRQVKNVDIEHYYTVRFRDYILVLERDFGKADLILGGLESIKQLKDISYDSFRSKELFGTVFGILDYPVLYTTEIKLLETMFVDPMTKTLLKQMNMPQTFKGMLIKACELLEDDNYKHPNDVSGQVIKGYERINGMLYKSLITAVKNHENRSSFSKSKLTLDPYEVMSKIKDDSTTVLVDDLNPISYIKQTEDVSYLGEGGRSAIAMTKKTRVMHPSEIGVMSEATKDNGQVGVTAYTAPDPNVVNIRGIIKERDAKDLEWGQILSTAANVTPFGTHDDSNRLKFRPFYMVTYRSKL